MADQTISDKPPEKETDFVSDWIKRIEAASEEEKDWRKDGDTAVKAYKGDAEGGSKEFNIFHSNIETIAPALYNSTPAPDVRRRYADADPTGKAVADLLERALSYSVDAYDFDGIMKATTRDMTIVDRGLARVRYIPRFAPDGSLGYEEVTCEYVPWRSFRRGPGRMWSEVSWIAFEHFLSRKSLEGKVHPAVLEDLPFTHSASAKDAKDGARKGQSIATDADKRAHAWEIWDKDAREVNFISPDLGDYRLFGAADPLELTGFFPIPRPMQAIAVTDSLVPLTPYSIYSDLIKELNEVQRRIVRLVKQLRPRGGYATSLSDVQRIMEADDGELVPLEGAEMFAQAAGGIENAITWFPMEATVKALEQLVVHREQIKQTIYEVTGVSDILRGSTQPSETATAQQIKAQWGSLRVQQMQAEVARFARDLFRIKGEIIARKFQLSTLRLMTGLDFPSREMQQAQAQMQEQQASMAAQQGAGQPGMPPQPQQPQQPQQPPPQDDILSQPALEDVEKLMREDAGRGFRVDIESESTIRGDLTRNQQNMSLFLQGVAQFVGAVGPMVEKGVMPPEIAIELLSAFARNFKLGKQAEDVLDKWADKVRSMAAQPPPPQQPDPNAVKAEAEQKMGEMKLGMMQTKAALDGQSAQRKDALSQAQHERDMTKLQADVQADTALTQNEVVRTGLQGQYPVQQWPSPGQM